MQRVTLMGEQDGLQGRDCLALIAFFHISYYQPQRVDIDRLRFRNLCTHGSWNNMNRVSQKKATIEIFDFGPYFGRFLTF